MGHDFQHRKANGTMSHRKGIRDDFDPISDWASTPEEEQYAVDVYKTSCGRDAPQHVIDQKLSILRRPRTGPELK